MIRSVVRNLQRGTLATSLGAPGERIDVELVQRE
jgi:hypothetical protein